MSKPVPFVMSRSDGQHGFDLDHYRREMGWYEDHLRSIFRRACTCEAVEGCDECSDLVERFGDEEVCQRHECGPCVAEHALWVHRDHPHDSIAAMPPPGEWERICDGITSLRAD